MAERGNIVTASFSRSYKAETDYLWQWDYGQILLITGLELPSVFEVHFANRSSGTTKTVLGNDNTVEIPDELLQDSRDISAYIYLHADLNDGETEYKITIPVKPRPKPSNETPTPVEQDIITETIAALQDEAGKAEKAAESAADYAEQAKEAAESIDETMIGEFVAEYLDDHPVTVVEEDPTVPSWAKQSTKPSYTAQEVGAVPSSELSNLATKTELADKVDKVSGKGLSANDFTDTLKGKLDGIEAGAQVNPDLSHYITDSDYDPESKTSDMTQSVGVDENGKLWTAPGGGSGDVQSVNGQTGIVVLDADDVGALPDDTTAADLGAYVKPSGGIPASDLASGVIPTVPVQSVNGKTGAVTLDAEDVGALPDDTTAADLGAYVKLSGGIPKTDLESAVQTSLGKADSALQSFTETDPTVPAWAKAQSKPTYTASEVGLGNVDNVQQYSANNPPPYPVTSVNNQTGAVSLSIPSSASDVGAVASNQGVANAGKFMVVGSDGIVAPVTMAAWSGGSY